MNDLPARLDRAADELTRAAIPPPAVAIRRRGQRRRQQRLVAAAVVVVAILAGALGTWGRPVQPGASGTFCHSWPGHPGPGSHAAACRSWADRRCRPAPNSWAPGAAAGRGHPVLHHPHLGPGVSIYSEATVKGEMRPVELVPPVPGRRSTGPADMAAVEVRPSRGNQPSRHLTIHNGTARSELQAADGSRGWAVGPHRLTDHNGKTIQPPGPSTPSSANAPASASHAGKGELQEWPAAVPAMGVGWPQ
jgi:hypothetical protein